MSSFNNAIYPLQCETEKIIGLCYKVFNNLGFGYAEVIYKDALQYEFSKTKVKFEREKKYNVHYERIILAHKYFADFVVFDSIILEIKTKSDIPFDDVLQTLNYLKCSGCLIGLLVNFARRRVVVKRILNPDAELLEISPTG